MVLADQLVMDDGFEVTARVAGKMVKEMGFSVHTEQVARVNLVLMTTS
jgi:translation initiation factor IF-1